MGDTQEQAKPYDPYSNQAFADLITQALDRYAPQGHPDFNDIVLGIVKLHSDKNHDYARGGDPLGNFKRSVDILGKYWHVFATPEGPAVLAILYAMKQIDNVLWSLSQGGENVCEGLAQERHAALGLPEATGAAVARADWMRAAGSTAWKSASMVNDVGARQRPSVSTMRPEAVT